MDNVSLALIGLSGSGKSTIGRLVADSLELPCIDIDSEVERIAGCSITDLCLSEGEEAFRDLESEVLRSAVTGPKSVIATGGGIVDREKNRELLREHTYNIWVDTSISVLTERLREATNRPLLLGGDLEELLYKQRKKRFPFYSTLADVVIDTGGSLSKAAPFVHIAFHQRSESISACKKEVVSVGGGRDYTVVIGKEASSQLSTLLPAGVARAAIVTQEGIPISVDSGVEQKVFVVEDGEQVKKLSTIEDLCTQFSEWGLTRRDVVISVGGGVVSDLAGFAAASYHRGVSVIHVSTSLLGQVDAAIGGKCGVNLSIGKNLVGAFWQPSAVVCDTNHLHTLPVEEFRSGLGEIAKYHFIQDRSAPSLAFMNLSEKVAACVRIKADVVASDERESGRRAILNYGHTLAHALETSGSYALRHGEAVAIGLVYAAELGHLLGRITQDRVDEHYDVVKGYGLDVSLPEGLDQEKILALFKKDKKAIHGITFILDSEQGLEEVLVEDHGLMKQALEKIT